MSTFQGKTPNPFGAFVQAQNMTEAEKADFLDWAVRSNLATSSIMDDFQLCRDLKDRLPNCVVVFRDSNFEPAPGANNAKVILDYVSGIQSKDKRIVIKINTEQGFSRDRCNMYADMIEAVDPLGWKLCVGNTSSGSVKVGYLINGVREPNEWIDFGERLLKTLAAHPGHYIGFNNYTSYYTWFVANDNWNGPDQKPAKLDWSKQQYHIGRDAVGIIAACLKFGIDVKTQIRAICAEGVLDALGDIENHAPGPTVKSNRWRYLIEYWKTIRPGIDAEDVLFENVRWVWEAAFEPLGWVIGIHFFTWHSASSLWEDDRIDNAWKYRQSVENYHPIATQPAIPPETTGAQQPAPAPIAIKPDSPAIMTPDSDLAVTTGTQQPAPPPAPVVDPTPPPTQPVTNGNTSPEPKPSPALDNAAIRVKLQALKLALGTLTDEVDTLLASLPA